MAVAIVYETHPKVTFGAFTFRKIGLTFTGVTGAEISTGLSNVIGAWYQPNGTDDHGIVYLNSASASTTEDDLGSVYIDSVTSDDTGFLYAYGAA